MNRNTTLLAMVSAIAVAACAGVLGVEDGLLDPPAAAVQSTDAGSAADAPPRAMQDAGPDVVGVVVPDTCPTEQPDALHGVFVSPGGSSQVNCGSKGVPCSTIQLGVTRAKEIMGTTTVYVDTGKYAETVRAAGGIVVQGGWDDVGGTWRRQCFPTRAASVVITGAPPGSGATDPPAGVIADALDSEAIFDTLTISVGTTEMPAQGQTRYGVMALGASTVLTLRDVTVNVGDGASGAAGDNGSSGPDGSVCTGKSGAAGANGSMGSAATPGTFGPTGYVPASGSGGTNGTSGDGTVGGSAECGVCVTCKTDYPTCTFATTSQTCGSDSSSGCGGGGGTAGEGGQGGGSSVALFAWQAKVNVFGGGLRAGSGGGGGAGGSGGGGGQGTSGSSGANASSCSTSCQASAVTATCDGANPRAFNGGAGGAVGGGGGNGGGGGGGAGGDAYAVYKGSGAVVTPTGTLLVHGMAGGGGAGGGAPGSAADVGP